MVTLKTLFSLCNWIRYTYKIYSVRDGMRRVDEGAEYNCPSIDHWIVRFACTSLKQVYSHHINPSTRYEQLYEVKQNYKNGYNFLVWNFPVALRQSFWRVIHISLSCISSSPGRATGSEKASVRGYNTCNRALTDIFTTKSNTHTITGHILTNTYHLS